MGKKTLVLSRRDVKAEHQIIQHSCFHATMWKHNMNKKSLLLSHDDVRARDEELLNPITPKTQTPKTLFTRERVVNRRVLNNLKILHGYNCLWKTANTRPTDLVEIGKLYRQLPVQARPRTSFRHPAPTINRCETGTRWDSQLYRFHAMWKNAMKILTSGLLPWEIPHFCHSFKTWIAHQMIEKRNDVQHGRWAPHGREKHHLHDL